MSTDGWSQESRFMEVVLEPSSELHGLLIQVDKISFHLMLTYLAISENHKYTYCSRDYIN